MVGRLHLNPATAAAFWNASAHYKAPPLNTTYGNFTTVNSISRFTVTVPANTFMQFIHCYSSSCIRTFMYNFPSLGAPDTPIFRVWAQQQLNSANTVPLDVRPLRLSVKMRNTTQNLNIAGSVKSVLVPQSLLITFNAANGLSTPSVNSLWNLVAANPHAVAKTGVEMTKGHTFVMPPASYIAYNSYSDWVPVSANADNGNNLTTADFNALLGLGVSPVYPYTPSSGWPMSEIPSNHFMLTNFDPNPLAQTYEMEVYSQDGVRYPANTLAASVATRPARNSVPDATVQQTAVTASGSHVQPNSSAGPMGSRVADALDSFDRIGDAVVAGSSFAGSFAPEARMVGGLMKGAGAASRIVDSYGQGFDD